MCSMRVSRKSNIYDKREKKQNFMTKPSQYLEKIYTPDATQPSLGVLASKLFLQGYCRAKLMSILKRSMGRYQTHFRHDGRNIVDFQLPDLLSLTFLSGT